MECLKLKTACYINSHFIDSVRCPILKGYVRWSKEHRLNEYFGRSRNNKIRGLT
jgi:hypothetical protein